MAAKLNHSAAAANRRTAHYGERNVAKVAKFGAKLKRFFEINPEQLGEMNPKIG
ncbi:MAG: hypothetical protein ABI444_12570 [Candidatus Kapaibacterium sp.]|jgi:hypothetical protein